MAAADATVLASAWEGLPNVVIEFAGGGHPIVSTDVAACARSSTKGERPIVPPRRPLALASAMAA